MLKILADLFRGWADKLDPPPIPARLPIGQIRYTSLGDYFAEVFGVDLDMRGKDTDEVKHILTTLGIEYYNGCVGGYEPENPCPTKLDVVESDIVYVMANPYGYSPPFIAIVGKVSETPRGIEYLVMDITGRASDLIPCGCSIRKLDDVPFGDVPLPHWDGNQKAKELNDAWWNRKPSTSKEST